uniref:Uncharacterized protein n=1 Tax=Lactuca sativa TaxID=4236 RepID=A0A9R1WW82_LACSA|nr:hypothetical protein LSAT_V11C900458950 [Lactuca sativa]
MSSTNFNNVAGDNQNVNPNIYMECAQQCFKSTSNYTTRTPLFNITNGRPNNFSYHNNENINSNISGGYQHTSFQSTLDVITSSLSNDAKDKRKLRKLYLDNKKCKDMTTTPNGIFFSIMLL